MMVFELIGFIVLVGLVSALIIIAAIGVWIFGSEREWGLTILPIIFIVIGIATVFVIIEIYFNLGLFDWFFKWLRTEL